MRGGRSARRGRSARLGQEPQLGRGPRPPPPPRLSPPPLPRLGLWPARRQSDGRSARLPCGCPGPRPFLPRGTTPGAPAGGGSPRAPRGAREGCPSRRTAPRTASRPSPTDPRLCREGKGRCAEGGEGELSGPSRRDGGAQPRSDSRRPPPPSARLLPSPPPRGKPTTARRDRTRAPPREAHRRPKLRRKFPFQIRRGIAASTAAQAVPPSAGARLSAPRRSRARPEARGPARRRRTGERALPRGASHAEVHGDEGPKRRSRRSPGCAWPRPGTTVCLSAADGGREVGRGPSPRRARSRPRVWRRGRGRGRERLAAPRPRPRCTASSPWPKRRGNRHAFAEDSSRPGRERRARVDRARRIDRSWAQKLRPRSLRARLPPPPLSRAAASASARRRRPECLARAAAPPSGRCARSSRPPPSLKKVPPPRGVARAPAAAAGAAAPSRIAWDGGARGDLTSTATARAPRPSRSRAGAARPGVPVRDAHLADGAENGAVWVSIRRARGRRWERRRRGRWG